MCDIGKAWDRATAPVVKAFERAITVPGTGGREAAEQSTQAAQQSAQAAMDQQAQAAQRALQAQEQAAAQARAAADTNSEVARQTADQRMRKLLMAGAFGARSPGQLAPAQTAVRTLFGT